MITYGSIEFGSAPKTGCTWFDTACRVAGLTRNCYQGSMDLHSYFRDASRIRFSTRVTIWRNPCDWLLSFYHHIYPIKVPFGVVSDQLYRIGHAESFDEFVELVLKKQPGIVGRIFQAYKADVRLFTESINEGFCSLISLMGVSRERIEDARKLKPVNTSSDSGIRLSVWRDDLKQRFMESEQEILEAMKCL